MSSPSMANEYPIDLVGPDIGAYAEGNTGIPYIWSFEADRPGPHAMISAVVHGNEPAGAVAIDWLMREKIRPTRGTMTLAFMNIEAYLRFDPEDPNATRWVDEDFNRVWADDVLDGDRDSVELRRARQVRPMVAATDFLLDIHTMQHLAPPVMMAGWLDKGVDLARTVGVPELIIADRGHASGLRMRDHGAFADPAAENASVLIECGQHWQASSGPLAIESAIRFLDGLGMIDPDVARNAGCDGPAAPQSHWIVEKAVTIENEQFTFAEKFTGGEILPRAGTLLGHDGEIPVHTPFDDCLLIMPSKRLWKGQTAVRLAKRG